MPGPSVRCAAQKLLPAFVSRYVAGRDLGRELGVGSLQRLWSLTSVVQDGMMRFDPLAALTFRGVETGGWEEPDP